MDKILEWQIRHTPLLTQNEVLKLFESVKNGDKEAANAIFEAHLKLVFGLAFEYSKKIKSVLILDDLFQEGSLGLLRAIANYKSWFKKDFLIYAHKCVRNAITDSITENNYFVRVPKNVIKDRQDLLKKLNELEQKFGRTVFVSDLKLNGKKQKRASIILDASKMSHGSANTKIKADSDLTYLDAMADKNNQFENAFNREELLWLVSQIENQKAKQVIIMRFDLFDKYGREMSFDDIGKKLNLSNERIRQIFVKTLAELRLKLTTEKQEKNLDDVLQKFLYADDQENCTPAIIDKNSCLFKKYHILEAILATNHITYGRAAVICKTAENLLDLLNPREKIIMQGFYNFNINHDAGWQHLKLSDIYKNINQDSSLPNYNQIFSLHADKDKCIQKICYYLRRLGFEKINNCATPNIIQQIHKKLKT